MVSNAAGPSQAARAIRTTNNAVRNLAGITGRGRSGAGSGSGPHDDDRRPARCDTVDRLVAERIGQRVLGPRYVRRRPAVEATQDPTGLLPQGDQLGILDPPATGQLLDDELGVQEQVDLASTQLAGEAQGPDDGGVLRDVVRLDAEELRDRRVGAGSWVAGVRTRGVDERGAGRSRPGIAARGPVGSDDQAERPIAGGARRRWPQRRLASAVAVGGAQPGSPPGPDGAPDPGNDGIVGAGASSSSVPRSFRQTIWIGS
ncbi:MAG: hypothetical protein QOD78_2424 [Chloroflexota bacterium]|nr:hypothetical protein [Chloroflexota bacterium]